MSQTQLALTLDIVLDAPKANELRTNGTRFKRARRPVNTQEKMFAKWKDKITLSFSEIDVNNPDHIALLNSQGMPFKTIEQIFGIPHSTAHERAKSVVSRTRHFSLMNVVCREYLQDKSLSERDKEKIKNWVNNNAGALIGTEGRFFTQMQEKTLQKWEGCDFDVDLIGGEDAEAECF